MTRIEITQTDVTMADRMCREVKTGAPQMARPLYDIHRSRMDQLMEGYLGEIAYCRYFGIPMRDTVIGADGGVDLEVGGVSIDVKATRYKPGKLMMFTLPEHPADYFALANGVSVKSVGIAGVISTAEFQARAKREDFGHGLTWWMDAADLLPATVLQRRAAEDHQPSMF